MPIVLPIVLPIELPIVLPIELPIELPIGAGPIGRLLPPLFVPTLCSDSVFRLCSEGKGPARLFPWVGWLGLKTRKRSHFQ